MLADSREPVTKTGPCGISCAICRFRTHGQCQCCMGEGASPSDKTACSPCPIVQCVSTRNVSFCARDCLDFPCPLLERTIPYRWSRLASSCSDRSSSDRKPSNPWQNPTQHENTDQDGETLRVFCLGQFRVFRGSVELHDHHWGHGKGPTQKIKALFAFLLHQGDQGVCQETLLDLLWPQQTDLKRASSCFHQALFHLRRALEPALRAGAASSYIRWQGDRYFFSPLKSCWVDADVFAAYAKRAQTLELGGDSDAAIAYWIKAISLYGGDYMAGIDLEYTQCSVHDWCATRCHQLRQLYLTASMTVARYKFDSGRYDLAAEYARQALNVEPALEPAHRLLIQCLLEIGHLDSAICQYRTCKAELARSEDRAPSEKTQMLYQRLLETP